MWIKGKSNTGGVLSVNLDFVRSIGVAFPCLIVLYMESGHIDFEYETEVKRDEMLDYIENMLEVNYSGVVY